MCDPTKEYIELERDSIIRLIRIYNHYIKILSIVLEKVRIKKEYDCVSKEIEESSGKITLLKECFDKGIPYKQSIKESLDILTKIAEFENFI